MLYLDYNATAPIHPEVLESMITTYKDNFGNAGSRTHVFGQWASQAVETAREQVANLLGVCRGDVIWTSGATESNNLAILGLAHWGKDNNRMHIISTSIEHKSVLEPLEYLRKHGFEVELVPVGRTGRVKADDVLGRVRADTLMVSVMHVNNETGVIQPVREIGRALSETPVYFHVDAAQSFGKLVEELRVIDYDLLSISAHKAYGPQGVGALVLRGHGYSRAPIHPLMFGGGQERGLRPGTLPVALIVGMGKAAELAAVHFRDWLAKNQRIKSSILGQLQSVKHIINGSLEFSLPNCLNISFPGVDAEALMLALRKDIAVSNGSACTSAEYKPSHVLSAMGLDSGTIDSAIRMSWGHGIPTIDLTPLVLAVKSLQ